MHLQTWVLPEGREAWNSDFEVCQKLRHVPASCSAHDDQNSHFETGDGHNVDYLENRADIAGYSRVREYFGMISYPLHSVAARTEADDSVAVHRSPYGLEGPQARAD